MARGLAMFLDGLDQHEALAKTILYNLNPRDNELFATMVGNFNDGSVPGKMQYGASWWFLDQKDGIEAQFQALSDMGLLSRFVGPASPGELPAPLRRLLEAAHSGDGDGDRDGDSDGAPASFVFRAESSELVVKPFFHPSTGPGLLLLEQAGTRAAGAPLSAREREVLDWMTEGKTNAEIATILGISLHTVKRHVEKILQKLGVPNRGAAARSRITLPAPIGPSTYPDALADSVAC